MTDQALSGVHLRHGVVVASDGALPSHYGDAAAERRAARQSWVVADLSDRGRLMVTGRDRATFLQGMISNDTRELTPGRGLYATHLEPKGHMLADLTLYALEDAWLADTEPGFDVALAAMLNRFIIREKVKVDPVGERMASIGVAGPDSLERLGAILGVVLDLPGPYSCVAIDWRGRELSLLRRDFTGDPGIMVWVEHDCAEELWSELTDAGAVPAGARALELLRIEAGIPRFGMDTSEEVIPLEAGLFHGISRDKGCYVGQEVVERISSRGHTNRRLAPLRFDGPLPPAGAEIRIGDRSVGRVTSAGQSPEVGPVGLGYVRREAMNDERLMASWEGGQAGVEVLERPLFGSGNPPSVSLSAPPP